MSFWPYHTDAATRRGASWAASGFAQAAHCVRIMVRAAFGGVDGSRRVAEVAEAWGPLTRDRG